MEFQAPESEPAREKKNIMITGMVWVLMIPP